MVVHRTNQEKMIFYLKRFNYEKEINRKMYKDA